MTNREWLVIPTAFVPVLHEWKSIVRPVMFNLQGLQVGKKSRGECPKYHLHGLENKKLKYTFNKSSDMRLFKVIAS